MVGAVTFLRDYIGICRNSKCSSCKLNENGVCINQLEKFDNSRINKAIAVVRTIKMQEENAK